MKTQRVQIEYSNRHIHPTEELIEKLFGPEYSLTPEKKLSQCEDFAAKETITLIGPKGKLENVRIIGPVREKTQIEILRIDAFLLGIDVPMRLSEDIDKTPGIKITGPLGEVDLEHGLIIAKRHLHLSPQEAKKMSLKHLQKIKLKIKGERALIFDEIIVRVKQGFQKRIHLDMEEANAAGINQNDIGEIMI